MSEEETLHSKNNKGFTIVELMTIIAVLGIIGSIAIPAFRDYIPRMRLRRARDEVLATLRFARIKALSERQTYQVIFERATNSYRVEPGGNSVPLPLGVSITNSTDITYEFRPDRTGATSPSSDVILVNERNKRVQFHLIEATGYIRVVE